MEGKDSFNSSDPVHFEPLPPPQREGGERVRASISKTPFLLLPPPLDPGKSWIEKTAMILLELGLVFFFPPPPSGKKGCFKE